MEVVNVNDYGGVRQAVRAGVKFCGRPSALGNPCSEPGNPCPVCGLTHFGHRMVQLTHCRSLECYRRWLWGRIVSGDRAVMLALSALKGDDLLGCFCHPKPCHCDIVIKAWHWCRDHGKLVN